MHLEPNNLFFLINLLAEIYSIDKEQFEHKESIESVKIPLSEEVLKKNFNWVYLLGKSHNYKQIFQEYKAHLEKWEEKYQEFNTLVGTDEFDTYLEKFITYPFRRTKIRQGKISEKELRDNLLQVKPKISQFFKGGYYGYNNFLIYENKYFHLTVHFNFTKKPTKTFEITMLFSLWFERPKSISSLDIEWIHNIYQNLLLGYEISNYLRNLGFSEEKLFDIEQYNPKNYNEREIFNKWIQNKPLLFVNYIQRLMNANPILLFKDFASYISQLKETIHQFLKSKIKSPQEYFRVLTYDLEVFIKRGKFLFQKAEHAYDFFTHSKERQGKKLEPEIKISKKTALTPELLLKLFQLAFEQDTENGAIQEEDKGYRSLSQIHKQFGEDYKFSKQTVYNCFNKSDLEYRLERREKEGKGGGIEYRHRPIVRSLELKPQDLDHTFMKERMVIEESLIFFNEKIFQVAKERFKDVLRAPSKVLKENLEYYLGSKYYLGKIYYEENDFQNALKYFKVVYKENDSLFDNRYYLMMCGLFLEKSDELNEIIEENIKNILEIFKKYELEFEKYKLLLISKFTPDIEESRKFFRKILRKGDLTQHAILINLKELEHRVRFFSHKDKGDVVHYNRNIIAYEILFKCLTHSLIIKIELIRQKVYRNIIEKDVLKIQELLQEFIILQQDELVQKSFDDDFFYPYIKYFMLQLKYYPIDYDIKEFEKLVQTSFPKFKMERFLLGSSYPDELKYINTFISHINGTYDRIHWNTEDSFLSFEPSLNIRKLDFKIPEYNLEYILTNYLIIKNSKVLEDRSKEIQSEFTEVKNEEDKTIQDFLDFWFEFRSPYFNKYVGINHLKDTIESGINLIQKYNLLIYKEIFNEIFSNVTKFAKKINDIREKGRIYTINKIFELLCTNYEYKESFEEINLDFTPEQYEKEDSFYNIIEEILNSFIKDINGKKTLRLKFFNNEMKEEGMRIVKIFHRSYRISPFRLKIINESLEAAFEIIYEAIIHIHEEYTIFDNLEVILQRLISVIKKDCNQIVLKSKALRDKDFLREFKQSILKEFENDYFEFDFKNFEEENKVLLSLSKI